MDVVLLIDSFLKLNEVDVYVIGNMEGCGGVCKVGV